MYMKTLDVCRSCGDVFDVEKKKGGDNDKQCGQCDPGQPAGRTKRR